MAGRALSFHSLSGNPGETIIKVKKPHSNRSREIRDKILREYFGYTEADLAEFKRQRQVIFRISQDGETDWADFSQVMKWKVDSEGNLSIPTPDRLVNKLNDFRDQRASFEIFKVGMFISNSLVRKNFIDDLEIVLSASGDKRINALHDLMITIGGSGRIRFEIFRALRFLTNESGYKDNPFLLIALARTTVYRSETPSMGSEVYDHSLIERALKATNEDLYENSTKSIVTKLTRQEAAAINYWASDLYSQSNAEYKANQRKWVERFLNMTDVERATLQEGDSIKIVPPGATYMGTPSVSEKRLDNLNSKMEQTKEEWRANDEGRRIVEPTTPNATNDINIQTPTKPILEQKGSSFPMNQQKKDAYPPQQKQPQQFIGRMGDERSNQSGINQITKYGNAAGLVLEYFKWRTFHQRMSELTRYFAAKERLQRQIQAERTHIIPPRPEIVKLYIKDFRRYGRLTVNPFEKQTIVSRLADLQDLLEESNAFYR